MLDGLPKYGVTLSGSPNNPVIENRSGKTVIAYVFVNSDSEWSHIARSATAGDFHAAGGNS